MLEIKNISAGYGKHRVIEDISAAVEKGRLTSIIGINGCGKSTLIKAALGIMRVSEGQIILDGEDISRMKRREIAQKMAYLPQQRVIPDMTVFAAVLHGRYPYLTYPRGYSEKDREAALKAIEAVGLLELAERQMSELSGGMRQRAYLAACMCQDTDYILLDEPTTHLDPSNKIGLMRQLRHLADGGRGIVAVMHELPLCFDFSDEIILMGKGRILCVGTPEELCSSSLLAEELGVELRRAESGEYYCRYLR